MSEHHRWRTAESIFFAQCARRGWDSLTAVEKQRLLDFLEYLESDEFYEELNLDRSEVEMICAGCGSKFFLERWMFEVDVEEGQEEWYCQSCLGEPTLP